MTETIKNIAKIRFLVVDDMDAIRTLVKACLKDLGATQIVVAFDGESAWDYVNSQTIDVIISDWDMPKMSGIELLTKVRSHEEYNHIPFLLLTAVNEKGNVVEALKAGVTDYLSKPFQPKELGYRVVKLLPKVKLG